MSHSKKNITIKDIKRMIEEPVSKAWFKKHGTPKSGARTKALQKRLKEEENPFGKFQQRGGLPPGYKQSDLE